MATDSKGSCEHGLPDDPGRAPAQRRTARALAHRSEAVLIGMAMPDDPLVFALRDRVSQIVIVLMAAALLIAA